MVEEDTGGKKKNFYCFSESIRIFSNASSVDFWKKPAQKFSMLSLYLINLIITERRKNVFHNYTEELALTPLHLASSEKIIRHDTKTVKIRGSEIFIYL